MSSIIQKSFEIKLLTTALKIFSFNRIDLLRCCKCIYNERVVADRCPEKDFVIVQFG